MIIPVVSKLYEPLDSPVAVVAVVAFPSNVVAVTTPASAVIPVPTFKVFVTVKIPLIVLEFSHIKSFTTISSPVVLVIATVLIPLTFLIFVT